MLAPDAVLVGRYQIQAVIGVGGCGKVYRALDLESGREVAIKELLHDTATVSPETWLSYRERFLREARIVSHFSHPNVVSAYALETDAAGNMYLVLEYVAGGSLKDLLQAQGRLSIERALSIACDLAEAVEALYQQDIVHRDIKPSNVLLTTEGTARLTDLGVAQVGTETRRTQEAHGHPGTPAYKSPEQGTTTGYLDQRSDLYAVGLVLYEMLTGQAYVRQQRPPRVLVPEIPAALDAVVQRALEVDPARRYQTAAEMRHDLESVRHELPWPQARTVLHQIDRRRLAIQVGVVLVLLLLLGFERALHLGVESRLAAALALTPSATAEGTLIGETSPLAEGLAGVGETPSAMATATVDSIGLATDAFEPDDELPVAMAVGETQQRSFDSEGDVDRVTLRVEAGHTYQVATFNLASGVDTRLEVLVDGDNLGNDDASPGTLASQVLFSAAADGTVVVNVYNEDRFGPGHTYELSAVEVPTTPTATALPTPSAEPTRHSTATPQPTYTPRTTTTPRTTATTRPTSTRTPTRTRTATLTRTSTRTPTASKTPTRTATATLTPTHTLTPSLTATHTPTFTSTPESPTATYTPEPPTATYTPVPESPTATYTPESSGETSSTTLEGSSHTPEPTEATP